MGLKLLSTFDLDMNEVLGKSLKCKTLAVICSLGENKTRLSRFSRDFDGDVDNGV